MELTMAEKRRLLELVREAALSDALTVEDAAQIRKALASAAARLAGAQARPGAQGQGPETHMAGTHA